MEGYVRGGDKGRGWIWEGRWEGRVHLVRDKGRGWDGGRVWKMGGRVE